MRGFSLIEVLIALALFTFMTLTVTKMQVIAIQTTRDAIDLSVAKQLVSNLAGVVCQTPLKINFGGLYREWQQTITNQLALGQGLMDRQQQSTKITLNWDISTNQRMHLVFSCPTVTKG